jgi:hypothetical protein
MRIHRLLRLPGPSDKGQASFEFLLVLPSFILFVLLIVDFGIWTFEYVSVSNAVREGARYAAVNCGSGTCASTNDIRDRAIARSSGILSTSDTYDIGWIDRSSPANASRKDRGDSIKVKATHTYNFLFFPVHLDVTSCADMRLEQSDGGPGTAPASNSC